MLVKGLLALCDMLVSIVLTVFSVLPTVPPEVDKVIMSFLDLVFSNSSLFSFFVPVDFCIMALGISVIIMNFDKIYTLLIFVLKKIPGLGIE